MNRSSCYLSNRIAPSLLVVLVGSVAAVASASDENQQAAREQAFSQQLSGATLVGLFTVDGQEPTKPAEPERYELGKVTKVEGRDHDWTFVARIQYAQWDVKVPLTLKVYWADDTPVISLTDLAIPGLGTFTARVMFHGERYVGTWQHGEVGGHMYGRIERGAREAGTD